MRNKTIIYVRWKITDRIEIHSTLGSLFNKYPNDELGISKSSVYKKDIVNQCYGNDSVEIRRIKIG